MRLIDTHSHIHDRSFGDDADAALDRARAAGVELVLTLGENVENSRAAILLAERHAMVLAAAGVHPHDAKDVLEEDLATLRELLAHPRVALVGEIGLDFYRDLSPRDDQRRVLRAQLDIAREVSKPVAVHARDAHDEMLPLLTGWSRSIGGRLPGRNSERPLGVMHYFSGDAALARKYVDLGFLISVHTSVTHPKATTLQDVARDLSLEHLVLETDSPFGAPQVYRGKRNEPAYVAEAARKVAELKGVAAEEVAAATTDNALRLLGVAVAAGGR
jgi:TatD DNase family protein